MSPMLTPLLILPLLGPLPAVPTGVLARPAVEADESGRESLQEFLRRAREQRRALFEALRPRVTQLVERLEALGRPERRELGRIHEELEELGPEAAVLLLPYLEPGASPGEASRFRAREIASALSKNTPRSITPRLITLVGQGSKEARRNAMTVLGNSPDVELASVCLREAFENSTGELRLAAVTALARLGGEENVELLGTALLDQEAKVVSAVLDALTRTRSPEVAPRVLILVRGSEGGIAHRVVSDIVAYWKAVPDAVDEETLHALLDLAKNARTPTSGRVALLETVPVFDPPLNSAMKKALAPLLSASDTTVREAAQVCAALLGDRNARKELLRNYDDLVERQNKWPNVYEQRAGIHLRLRGYGDAVKDYKTAIKLLGEQKRSVDREIWIGLARAYALDGKEKQSHDALQDAKLPPSVLSTLAEDPDFASIADHARYGRIFES
jgi:HEAT repeat protein